MPGDTRSPPPTSFFHGLSILPTGLIVKAFLALGTRSCEVHGLSGLLDLLRSRKRGVLTISNHVSVLDEPLCWGVLPWRTFLQPKEMRWTLGASDIVFKQRLFRSYFRNGQVIETFRGGEKGGIYQPAVDLAIDKLRDGQWGKVNQDPLRQLLRFRWGASRMLLEAGDDVEVVPMWIQGPEQIMPEERGFPRFLPRLGADVVLIFGSPITDRLRPLVQAYRSLKEELATQRPTPPNYEGEPAALRDARVKIVEVMREEVQRLGREYNEGKRPAVLGGEQTP